MGFIALNVLNVLGKKLAAPIARRILYGTPKRLFTRKQLTPALRKVHLRQAGDLYRGMKSGTQKPQSTGIFRRWKNEQEALIGLQARQNLGPIVIRPVQAIQLANISK